MISNPEETLPYEINKKLPPVRIDLRYDMFYISFLTEMKSNVVTYVRYITVALSSGCTEYRSNLQWKQTGRQVNVSS